MQKCLWPPLIALVFANLICHGSWNQSKLAPFLHTVPIVPPPLTVQAWLGLARQLQASASLQLSEGARIAGGFILGYEVLGNGLFPAVIQSPKCLWLPVVKLLLALLASS